MMRCAVFIVLGLIVGCTQPRTGVLVMAHGGDPTWNREVEATVAPFRQQMPTEIAFGMATPSTMEAAVQRLEAQGVSRIAVVRMFISGESFLKPTEYILGLRPSLPAGAQSDHIMPHHHHADHSAASDDAARSVMASNIKQTDTQASRGVESSHAHHMESPRRIKTNAKFTISREGVANSPLVDQILADRVQALSHDPASESVLILGHGPGDDAENGRWLAQMKLRATGINRLGRFRQVQCETLREDWPEKRVEAEKRIRQFVEDGSRDGGRVIVIPFRVAGFGPYREVLNGLKYVADERGFCPHPNMTQWLKQTFEATRGAN